eukprot:Gb_03746 [translate_table: standard]
MKLAMLHGDSPCGSSNLGLATSANVAPTTIDSKSLYTYVVEYMEEDMFVEGDPKAVVYILLTVGDLLTRRHQPTFDYVSEFEAEMEVVLSDVDGEGNVELGPSWLKQIGDYVLGKLLSGLCKSNEEERRDQMLSVIEQVLDGWTSSNSWVNTGNVDELPVPEEANLFTQPPICTLQWLVGFNSVYHLTDLPSFVSGKYVVFFDPQGKYLPSVSAVNPGKRIEFVSSAALSLYKDQFSPYCAFDCDMKKPYPGTLFRFPLRNMDQAGVSKLSRQSYSEGDIASLFAQLYTEAVFSMLFLKNVTTLEMYVWNADAQTPCQMYSCHLKSPNSELVWQRQALLRLSNMDKSAESKIDSFLLDFVSEAFVEAPNEEKKVDSFLVVQSMASSSSRIGVLANNAAKEHDLHLLPWASVAACISDSENKIIVI